MRDLEDNIWKLKLLRALYGFLLLTPVIVLFWQENGLSMTQVMLLQSLFAVAVILLEVPSGYMADVVGRRKTLLAAGGFLTVGVAVYSLGAGFFEFLAGEVLWAVGVSLVSGADSALLYDTLVDLGEEDSYQQHWGRATFYYLMAAAVASIIGGFIGDIGLRLVMYAQVPFIFLIVPVAFSLRESEHHRDVSGEERGAMLVIVRDCLEDVGLRWLMLYTAFIVAVGKTVFWLYQPYFKLLGIDTAHFGLLFAGFNVIAAGSSRYASRIETWIGKRWSLISLLGILVASLFLMGNVVVVGGVVFVFLQQFVRGFSKPVVSDYINEMVPSERRSTVLSTKSLFGRAIGALMMPFIGLVTDTYSIPAALNVLGVTAGVVGAMLLVLLLRTTE